MSNPKLVLLVGGARSGTTLLRLLLDAHPEIGCPAEAGLPTLMSHLGWVWSTVTAGEGTGAKQGAGSDATPHGDAPAGPSPEAPDRPDNPRAVRGTRPELSAAARAWIRRTVHAPMSEYCKRGAKRIYCDKSLDSVYHLDLVHELFPDVRVILLFRHVMDTIASGIEASPWGFNAHGYMPYVQNSPGNTVAALARYWLDHVDPALAWEKEHPDRVTAFVTRISC